MEPPPQPLPEASYVKLYECPNHGCFHLSIGKVVVSLTHRELLLLGASINRWWEQHPEQVERLEPFDFSQPEF